MYLVEIVHDEVEERGTGGGRSVELSSLVDLDLCDLCFLHFLLNLYGSGFCLLQVLHQRGVSQEITLRWRQARQQVILTRFQCDL